MVRKFIKTRSIKTGHPPGSMIHVGEKKVEKTTITLMDYDEQQLQTAELKSVEEAYPFRDTPAVSWINIYGLHETEKLDRLGQHFEIHPLTMEDILNTDQRPKVEFYDHYIYIVLKMFTFNTAKSELQAEQMSIILGNNYVLTFQERPGDFFGQLRERIRLNKGRIRKSGPDYLTYALIDIIIDQYFLILEIMGEQIETLQEEVLQKPSGEIIEKILFLKRELLFLRKTVWPCREVINILLRDESPLIHKNTIPFLRDIYDHTIQVVDNVETFRDMVSGLLDIYLSSISNRMNEVMKVLTIIATIFIPLTFLAGVYGMNFEYMPELKWPWSYPLIWIVMIGIFVGMMIFFKRKRWL